MAAYRRQRYRLELTSNELIGELIGDKEVILAAMEDAVSELSYAPNGLKGDRKFALSAVKRKGSAFEYISKILRCDKELVMIALKDFGQEYASNELKRDKKVVMNAVKSDGFLLRYASESLRGDKEVVMAAVENHCSAFVCASSDLKRGYHFTLAAMKGDPSVWIYLPT